MMAQVAGGIPPPLDDDVDDVAWALQTAQVQWKRAAYADAIVWLRRAIDAAMQAGQPQRANDLSGAAWRLTELMLSQAEPEPVAEPAQLPHAPLPAQDVSSGDHRRPAGFSDGGDIDALLQDAAEEIPISVAPQRARQESADTERKLTPAPPSTPGERTSDPISVAPVSADLIDDEATEAMEIAPPDAAYPTPAPAPFPRAE